MKNLIAMQIMAVVVSILTSCEDPGSSIETPTQIEQFTKDAMSNPVTINGITLSGSWRLVRDQGSYYDGDYRKEFDINLIEDPDHRSYKEYWTFDREEVMILTQGTLHGKNWNGYYEIFDMDIDLQNKMLTVDYVYDNGKKTYSSIYTITLLTETDLVLTIGSMNDDEFFQYTFRREDF